MNILTLNTEVQGGGANRIAFSLFQYYEEANHTSRFRSAIRDYDDPRVDILKSDRFRNPLFRLSDRLLRATLKKKLPVLPRILSLIKDFSEPLRSIRNLIGHEDFSFPGTRVLPLGFQSVPDVIHAHNLFGRYFDLRELPRISSELPLVWTLHDMWAFTGHCSYSKNCYRWEEGCGHCPDLSLPPSILNDSTAANLSLKRSIYKKSNLYIATPSQWLMDLAQKSILTDGIKEARVIQNGVEQDIFKPGDKAAAREKLGIPKKAITLLYAASGAQSNPYKDYSTLKAAFPKIIANNPNQEFLFLCVGEREPVPDTSGLPIRVLPWITDRNQLALYYHAADLFLHAANMENFPTTILEALSCGVPCVATNVGGIAEQIVDGSNGFLVKPRNPVEMADGVQRALEAPQGLKKLSEEAFDSAVDVYSRERMGRDYIKWFEELLDAA